ncbi:MAG: MFS transporter [Gemmatimonadota bacterium]
MAYNRRVVFAVACMGMLLFGIVLTTLGAILPELIARFGVSKAAAGSLFLLMTFGVLAGTLIFGPLVDRLGYRSPLVASCALVGVGLELIAFGTSLALVRAGVLLIGLGGGVVNVACNGVVADTAESGKAAPLSLLGVFFGIGAVGVPAALALLENAVSQSAVLAFVGGFAFMVALVTVLARFPAPKQPPSFPIAGALVLARNETLILFGLVLFLQSGMEMTVGGWISTFAREDLTLSGRAALLFLSLYWLGLMLARLALASILTTVSPLRALYGSLALAAAGAAVLLGARTTGWAGAGVFVVGAGFAAVFPIVLGWVGERYAANSGTAFSIALVMALTGGMTLSSGIGLIGDRIGMRASLLIVPAALALSAVLVTVATLRGHTTRIRMENAS